MVLISPLLTLGSQESHVQLEEGGSTPRETMHKRLSVATGSSTVDQLTPKKAPSHHVCT